LEHRSPPFLYVTTLRAHLIVVGLDLADRALRLPFAKPKLSEPIAICQFDCGHDWTAACNWDNF
jgi:hypothetical protein